MKIDIYTLLGMIKDGKAPQRIVFDNQIWNYRERTDMEGTILYKEYINEETDRDLFDEYLTLDILNDEVTILETTITMKDDKFTGWEAETKCDDEKNLLASNKIEKLEIDALGMLKDKNNSHIISIIDIVDKINEIIDKLNKE